jgi:two-component system phosphate regulon sensor histidine kinase PhoR
VSGRAAVERKRAPRLRLLYFALVPAIVLAVLVLGGIALRTTWQIEKARQQTVFDATLSLANERVQALDKQVIAQDTVVLEHVDLGDLGSIEKKWLPSAARETPTVRGILVVDLDHDEHDVLAFASRAPGREDDVFRRLLVARILGQLNLDRGEELQHLHAVFDDQPLLLGYWQRAIGARHYLIVAWHDVPHLVHDVLPRLYRDDRASRMNILDESGRIVFGPPIKGGGFTVGRPFPNTLKNWHLQIALNTADELGQKVERQRTLEIGIVGFAALVAVAGTLIVVIGAVRERNLAALKSDFVANVSHELKTPLSLVRMFAEMLLTGRAPSDEKRTQYLQIIVSESERLTALIENVLDFAKVERGKSAYAFARSDVGEVVARAVELYRYRAEREGMAVALTVDAGPFPAELDARAIELAVINLLDNAFKYAKEGGEVAVHVGASSAVTRSVDVRVADRGPGIDDEDHDRIFERFVRGKNATDANVRGSGIGLALVKHIAESHGGSVHVESPVDRGRGSAFVITLPGRPGELSA